MEQTTTSSQRAIVTGGASGIGRATARFLVKRGAQVLVADLNGDAAGLVSDELGPRAHSAQLDVADEGSVRRLIASADALWGGLDVLVNNAGVGTTGSVETTSAAELERLLSVNVMGTFLAMKHSLPLLRASGAGAIVNTCSVAAVVGLPQRAAYAASKGAVYALTRAAAIDAVAFGVRINCVLPGTTDTPWVRRLVEQADDPERAWAELVERQPHGRLVSAEEVASAICFLASPESGSITGAALPVDGGLTAR